MTQFLKTVAVLFAGWLLSALTPGDALAKVLNAISVVLTVMTGNPYYRASMDPLADTITNVVIYTTMLILLSIFSYYFAALMWMRKYPGEDAPLEFRIKLMLRNTFAFLPLPLMIVLSCSYSITQRAQIDYRLHALEPFLTKEERQHFASELYHVDSKAQFDQLNNELVDSLIRYGVKTTPKS